MNILDIEKMPDYNSKVKNGANSVSQNIIYWTDRNKVTCREHGACLCVSPDRKIWRCATCNEGAYLPNPPVKGGRGMNELEGLAKELKNLLYMPHRHASHKELREFADQHSKAIEGKILVERMEIDKAMHFIDHVIQDEAEVGNDWVSDRTMVKYLKNALDILEKLLFPASKGVK